MSRGSSKSLEEGGGLYALYGWCVLAEMGGPSAFFSVSPPCDVLSYRLWRNPDVVLCHDFLLILSGLILFFTVDWLDFS